MKWRSTTRIIGGKISKHRPIFISPHFKCFLFHRRILFVLSSKVWSLFIVYFLFSLKSLPPVVRRKFRFWASKYENAHSYRIGNFINISKQWRDSTFSRNDDTLEKNEIPALRTYGHRNSKEETLSSTRHIYEGIVSANEQQPQLR